MQFIIFLYHILYKGHLKKLQSTEKFIEPTNNANKIFYKFVR